MIWMPALTDVKTNCIQLFACQCSLNLHFCCDKLSFAEYFAKCASSPLYFFTALFEASSSYLLKTIALFNKSAYETSKSCYNF